MTHRRPMPASRAAAVEGVVLAAGASTRAGAPKALALYDGETFVARAIGVLHEGGCDLVRVVLGRPHGRTIEREVGDRATVVWNADPSRGQLGSLKCALRDAGDAHAVVVALVDHPRVRASTVTALVAAFRERRTALVQPRRSGRNGHPILIGRPLFDAVLSAPSEGGLRAALAGIDPAARCIVEVDDDPGIHDDVDTADDVTRIGATLPPFAGVPT